MPQPAPIRVCFVCSGNICRSPMAEVVLRELARRAGVEHLFDIDSAGTGDWHVGHPADRRAVRVLAAAGYDGDLHRARQFDPRWFDERDLVIALDRGHERALRGHVRAAGASGAKVRLLRSFDPAVTGADTPDVADPYYGDEGGFREVLEQVESACRGLLAELLAERDAAANR